MNRTVTSSVNKCLRALTSTPQQRSVAYITGTHKHLTRNTIFQPGSPSSYITQKPPVTSSKNGPSSSSHISSTYSNSRGNTTVSATSSSSAGAPVASQSRRAPTLGSGAEDNTIITNPVKTDSGETLKVKITQRAAQKLNAIKEADNNPDQILRILVESGGCHGYQYVLGLKSTSTIDSTEDCIFERDGAKFVIDSTSLQILRDSTIDYATELIGSQFKVINSPYATSSCGCGSSFDFDPSAIPQ